MPILPNIPTGKPGFLEIFIQVFPPSTDLYIAEPSPPLLIMWLLRKHSHIPAYNTEGLVGSMWISMPPVLSLMGASICCHEDPPSVER